MRQVFLRKHWLPKWFALGKYEILALVFQMLIGEYAAYTVLYETEQSIQNVE